jgi:hypothetical protein
MDLPPRNLVRDKLYLTAYFFLFSKRDSEQAAGSRTDFLAMLYELHVR